MTFRTIALAALLGTAAMTAQAGVLTQDGVTFSSAWTGDVLTLEIDAAGRSGGWSGATGLAALAIKGVGSFTGVKVNAAPGGTDDWNLSGAELKASGCSATASGAAGSRMCFYGRQIALADDMVFQFAFDGAGVTTGEPHVKVEFVDARGNKVGSLLSQTLPAGLPPAVAKKLNEELVKAIRSDEVSRTMVERGAVVTTSTPDEMRKVVVGDRDKWAHLVRERNITVE